MRRLLLILALTAITAGCATGRGPDVPARVERAGPDAVAGLAYAEQNCAGCHAIGARGRGPNRAAPPFRRTANRYTEVELSRRIAELETGHFRMPGLVVRENDLVQLMAYMRTLREPGPGRPSGG